MVGSRRYFQYTSDAGVDYAVDLDESIYETAALGFGQIQAAGTPVLMASSETPLGMRRINLVRVDGTETLRKTVFVGTNAQLGALLAAGTVTIDGNEWGISSTRGERVRRIPATDTEQLDGDVDDNIATGV